MCALWDIRGSVKITRAIMVSLPVYFSICRPTSLAQIQAVSVVLQGPPVGPSTCGLDQLLTKKKAMACLH